MGVILLLSTTFSYAEWPSLPFPSDAKVEAIGNNVRLNGVPMRMYRLLSRQNVEGMMDFYRGALGLDYVEAKVHRVKMLSQMRGDYFITVRVVPLETNMTETLIAISDGSASQSNQDMPLGFVLPAGSILLSDMESLDIGKSSRQLIFNNQHSMQANQDFLVAALQAKGYKLQTQYTQQKTNSLSLMFDGYQREAMVVVTRDAEKTNVVMTTIRTQ